MLIHIVDSLVAFCDTASGTSELVGVLTDERCAKMYRLGMYMVDTKLQLACF